MDVFRRNPVLAVALLILALVALVLSYMRFMRPAPPTVEITPPTQTAPQPPSGQQQQYTPL